MVVRYEESVVAPSFHERRYTLVRVFSPVVGLYYVCLRNESARVAPYVSLRGANLAEIVLLLCYKADVRGESLASVVRTGSVYRQLVAVERNKVLVAEVAVVEEYLVVGERYDGISVRLVVFLHFLGGVVTVGDSGVAVQVGFVALA